MTEPNDRALEQYLKGDSALSRRYREASRETAPAELDETVLALARAEARRKPRANRWLASLALAASLVLGVNLAWNVHQADPLSDIAPAAKAGPAEGPPATEKKAERPAKPQRPAAPPPVMPQAVAEAARAVERDRLERAAMEEAADAALSAMRLHQESVGAAAPSAAAPRAADHVPTEPQKIDALIRFVEGLQDAVFIRNGGEHTPQEAAQHLRSKLEKAGDRVQTADDFIRLCASFSSQSGEAYLIRFADGRTRTAEDVLREFLMQMNAAP